MCTASCECNIMEMVCEEIPCKCYKERIKNITEAMLTNTYDYTVNYVEEGKSKKRVVCPACLRHAETVKPRYAQMPHRDVVGYSYAKVLHLIGRIYHHKDGTICDETLCTINTLSKPVYLQRMGSKNDPRIP